MAGQRYFSRGSQMRKQLPLLGAEGKLRNWVFARWVFGEPHHALKSCSAWTLQFCEYYGLDVWLPPRFIYWNPSPQGDIIWRWGLWEVYISWRWNTDGTGVLMESRGGGDLFSACIRVSTQPERQPLPRTWPAVPWTDLRPPEPGKVSICCFSTQSMEFCSNSWTASDSEWIHSL